MNVNVTIGRTVLYALTEQDAAEINRRRTTGPLIAERVKKNTPDTTAWPLGAQAHIGNEARSGDVFPMIVTAVWPGDRESVNGQVLLDGNDCLWVTSVSHVAPGPDAAGVVPRGWYWPPRANGT